MHSRLANIEIPDMPPVRIPDIELGLDNTAVSIEKHDPKEFTSACLYTMNGLKVCELQLREPRFLFMAIAELTKGFDSFSEDSKKNKDRIDVNLEKEVKELIEKMSWNFRETYLL